MASVLIRGIVRGCHQHPIALQKFYSIKPSPKTTSDNGASKRLSNEKQPESGGNPERAVENANQKLADTKMKIEESQRKVGNVKDIRGYVLGRFMEYIKNYERVLEKKFPGAMKVYRVFMDGVKFFGRDMVDYMKIRTQMVIKGKEIDTMTRKELELYFQMPTDIRKVGPILLVSAIPFAHYVTMPIAYMYPRYFLTHHFWNLQQRSEFAVMNLRDRLYYNRPVFRSLQSKLSIIKNDTHYEQWRDALGKLGSGLHPSVEDIVSVKQLFAEVPYKTKSLSYSHIKNLSGLHGAKGIFTVKSKLAYKAMCLHYVDMAIKREGGARNLPTECLRDSCFMRGLNASNMSNEELIKFLDDWIEVSSFITPHNFSLLLHLPILLAYNHPNNWKVIYQER